MDRIEVGLDTAGSLIGRLSGARGSDRQYYRPDVLQRLAQQLYLLDAACGSLVDETPRDAFLSIEASTDPGAEDSAALVAFVGELSRMYLGWAERRRMRVLLYDPIEEREHSARVLLAISGFGSYRLLAPEHGLHVLEVPRDESSFSRLKARVRVAGQPADAGNEPGRLRRLAAASLARSEESSPSVVRRYRRDPSPLVRDAVRGWRTGNLDQVLAGDFDLFTD